MSQPGANWVTNAEALNEIKKHIAGGVSSTMRAAAIPSPLVVRRAQGCCIFDVEDNEIIDFNMGYGPHIFGYADRDVLDDVADQFSMGHMTGLPHVLDVEAGALITELVPSMELLRFANSGTEAVASAMRLARASTGRTLLVTFEGHYHGWSETVLRAGKGELHLAAGRPSDLRAGAPGMIPEALMHTRQVAWNDREAVQELFDREGDRIAAIIMEPILVNANVVPPAPGFLAWLRDLTARNGTLMIFDEVITGFRVARGGAQELYGVEPDLTILSKVLGGGIPVAAFGGRRSVMQLLVTNRAYHAGVYAGNHASVRAVISSLSKIRRRPDLYEELESIGVYLQESVREAFATAGQPVRIARVGSILSVGLLRAPVAESAGLREIASAIDFDRHRALQISAQREGVYFHPNAMEPWFLSTAHTREHLDKAVAALRRALDSVTPTGTC